MQILEESFMINSRDLLIFLILAATIVGLGMIARWLDLGNIVLALGGTLYVGFIVVTVLFYFYQSPRQYLVVFDEGVTVSENFHILEERTDGTTLIRATDDNVIPSTDSNE